MDNTAGFGDRLKNGFGAFADYLPDLIFGLILLAIAWGVAILVNRGVTKSANRLGFDRFATRYGLLPADRQSRDGSRTLGAIGGGLVFLLIALYACRVMRLYAFASGIERFFNYLPHIVAAAFILGVAIVIGDWLRTRLRAAPARNVDSESHLFAAGAVRAAVLTFGVFMALQELRIGALIVTLAFGLTFGAFALAAALAFGLGGRSTAAHLTHQWYEQARGPRKFIEPQSDRTPVHAPRPDTSRTELIDPAKRTDDEVLH